MTESAHIALIGISFIKGGAKNTSRIRNFPFVTRASENGTLTKLYQRAPCGDDRSAQKAGR
jgi:hypothetical protein